MSSTSDSLAVLVSTRTDPVSGRPARSQADAQAVALALRLHREPSLRHRPPPALRVIATADMPEPVAREYLGLGLECLELWRAERADDGVLPLLTAAVRDSALVLTGPRAEGGAGSGLLPMALAAALGRPLLADVIDLVPDPGQPGAWLATQAAARGARRRWRLRRPAVLSLAARPPAALRYSWHDATTGRLERHAAPPLPPAYRTTTAPEGEFVAAARRVEPLSARRARSGHDRMLGAIATPAAAGGVTLQSGTAAEKAQALLEYLRRHALVEL